ncbi:Zinc finger protein 1 like protein, partial [Trachymyrmex cornetzi]
LRANLVPTSWELLPWFCGECVKSPVDDHLFALLRLLCGGPFDLAVGDLRHRIQFSYNSIMHIYTHRITLDFLPGYRQWRSSRAWRWHRRNTTTTRTIGMSHIDQSNQLSFRYHKRKDMILVVSINYRSRFIIVKFELCAFNLYLKMHESHSEEQVQPQQGENCNCGFMTMPELREHQKKHVAKDFNCDYVTSHKKNLITHQKCHNVSSIISINYKYQCEKCGEQFQSKSNCLLHLLSHTSKKLIQCDMHQRRHTGERPYACDICGKSFISKKYLSKHCRMGEKQCTYCKKRFAQCSLIIHLRRHISDRLFPCMYCYKSFTTKVLLNLHLKMHAKRNARQQQQQQESSQTQGKELLPYETTQCRHHNSATSELRRYSAVQKVQAKEEAKNFAKFQKAPLATLQNR